MNHDECNYGEVMFERPHEELEYFQFYLRGREYAKVSNSPYFKKWIFRSVINFKLKKIHRLY